jgi:hypothetical protein
MTTTMSDDDKNEKMNMEIVPAVKVPGAVSPFAPANLEQAMRLATTLAKAGLVPDSLKGKPADVFTVLLHGHSIGLDPGQTLRGIHVINGRPVLAAELMVALVVCHPEVCEYFMLIESTPEVATFETRRRGHPRPTKISWTIEQARRVKVSERGQMVSLADRPTWQAHPAAMLRARASAALARAVYPDLVFGIGEDSEADEIRGNAMPGAPQSVRPMIEAPATTRTIRREDEIVEPTPAMPTSTIIAPPKVAPVEDNPHGMSPGYGQPMSERDALIEMVESAETDADLAAARAQRKKLELAEEDARAFADAYAAARARIGGTSP